MLDVETRRRIDTARDILVGRVPDPKSQVEQITLALMYKFMDDMDVLSESMGGKASFFAGDFARYSWRNIVGPRIGAYDAVNTYSDGITRMGENPGLPTLFRSMFSNAYLPFRDPETLRSFLQVIGEFEYENSERLGDAFEYLLSIMGSQGDAGQFRTPRHIIDFIVEIVDPKKDEIILDPACGTAGFLISAYKHILGTGMHGQDGQDVGLTPGEKAQLVRNVRGYDISPDMVRLSLVNLYLHGFPDPDIFEYDTLTSDDRWNQYANVILANPPFMSPKGGIRPHNRFSVTSRRSEVLFVDYIAEHLTPNGRAGVIVPEGIIFQSQNAHKQLRKMLVEEYLVAVVSLPPGVFNPYSGVKTSILILDKSLARQSDTIGFFKVENDGFDLGAQRRAVDRDDLPSVKADVKEYLRLVREGIYMDERDGGDVSYQFETGLVVEKERIGEDGEFNLSGERYRESIRGCSDFPMIPLGEICHVVNGSTPKRSEVRYWEPEEVPWFTVEDIRKRGRRVTKTSQNISRVALEETSLRLLPVKTVLLCCTASVGEYAFAEIALTTNQQFNGLIVKGEAKESLLPEFLFHLSSQLKEELIRLSGQTAFNFVSGRILKQIEIPVPPLTTQFEIVSEIEGYQKVIDGARAVVENWRPRIAVDPEWPVVELGEVATIQSGFGFPKAYQGKSDEEIPFLKVSDMNLPGNESEITNWNNSVSRVTLANLKAKSLPKGTVIFPKIGAAIATNKKRILTRDSTFDNNVMGIVPKNGRLLSSYLHSYLTGFDLSDWSSQAQPPSMRKTTVERHSIPLPSIATQETIVADIAAEEAMVDASRQLIDVMEGKVRDAVGRVWGE